MANREYIRMIQRLSTDEKRNLFCIEAVFNEAHKRNWRAAKSNLARAKQQYKDVVLPYWKDERDKHDRFQDLQLRAKARSFQNANRKYVHRKKAPRIDSSSLNPSNGSRKTGSMKETLFTRSAGAVDKETMSVRNSLLSGPLDLEQDLEEAATVNEEELNGQVNTHEQIVSKLGEAFEKLYTTEWQAAFQEIKKTQTGRQNQMREREMTKCLKEIVLKAFNICKDESVRQMQQLEQACQCVIQTGELKNVNDFKVKESAYTDFLVDYRKHMADLSITRIQNIFSYNHLDKILDKYSLKRVAKSPITAYAKKCAEVSWWLVVQRPPMFVLPGDEDAEFDTQLYKEYKKGGKFKVIEFIIWPALLDKEGGIVISKGIAQG
ncbi:hypothetical protein DPMN_106863 [Dreissena polymorpha]|uniref:Mitochondria-eating protein C-terminal domain-containing protein n=1 Tax=Dreissena polymorpha TaxID=45954 RepID=A0A9D4QK93_DREPO|nr:hypothetical protein DPMN_106863 [Dreissena polymorpha]